jgi:G3E family GTPase
MSGGGTATTLVVGGRASEREAVIAAALNPQQDSAVILEGLSDGHSVLADLTDSGASSAHIVRIAPGCLCCAGNMILRVTLNRLLRHPPTQLFISLANAEHVGQLRAWLSDPPYDQLLTLGDTMQVR